MADAMIAASLEQVGCERLHTSDSDFEDYAQPKTNMHILGINAYHGDVSAVLVEDGRLVAAL
jgi:hypothetical protein